MRFVFLFLISLFLITSDVLASGASTGSAAAGHDEADDGGGDQSRDPPIVRMFGKDPNCHDDSQYIGKTPLSRPFADQFVYKASVDAQTEASVREQLRLARGVRPPEGMLPAEVLLSRGCFVDHWGRRHPSGSSAYHASLTESGPMLVQPMTALQCLLLDAQHFLNRMTRFAPPLEEPLAVRGWVCDSRPGPAALYAPGATVSEGLDWMFHLAAFGETTMDCAAAAKLLRMLSLRHAMGREVFEFDASQRNGTNLTHDPTGTSTPYKDMATFRNQVGGVDSRTVVTYEWLAFHVFNRPTPAEIAGLGIGDIVSVKGNAYYQAAHPGGALGMINGVCVGRDFRSGGLLFVTYDAGGDVRVCTIRDYQLQLLEGFAAPMTPFERDIVAKHPWRRELVAVAQPFVMATHAFRRSIRGRPAGWEEALNELYPVCAVTRVKEGLFDPEDPAGSVVRRTGVALKKWRRAFDAGRATFTPAEAREELEWIEHKEEELREFAARMGCLEFLG